MSPFVQFPLFILMVATIGLVQQCIAKQTSVKKTISFIKKLPVYSPELHCSVDALQEQRFVSDGCLAGSCSGSTSDCSLCHSCVDKHFRSYNGACNNLDNIFSGRTKAPFERNIPISELYKEETPAVDVPNIRVVSQKLLRRDSFKPHKTLSLLGVAFQQFVFHDFIQRSVDPNRIVKVAVPPTDSVNSGAEKLEEIPIMGTEFTEFGCPFNFAQDKATAWIDGSQIYGSNADVNTELRTEQGGKIRLDENGRLEFRENGKAITGHPAGFWIGLFSFHTLFVLEHNAICDILADKHPDWTDSQLFNVARLINSAQILKAYIANQFSALVPGHDTTVLAKWLWRGVTNQDLATDQDSIPPYITKLYPSVLGKPKQDTKYPLSTAEDLTAVNRIHTTVPEDLEISSHKKFIEDDFILDSSPNKPKFTAFEFSFEKTENVKLAHSDEDIIFSLGVTRAGSVSLKNFPTSYLRTTVDVDESSSSTSVEFGFDMSLADLLRDRERGTPRYNQFLRALNLPNPSTFTELTNGDTDLAQELMEVYTDIEHVDLLIGLLVDAQTTNEGRYPFLTQNVTFAHFFRKISSDRFYTTDFNKETYTEEGLLWIERSNLKDIISRHYPDLKPIVDRLKNPLVDWDDVTAQNEAPSVDI